MCCAFEVDLKLFVFCQISLLMYALLVYVAINLLFGVINCLI